ncbi:hypothetical protein Q5P01_017879 [Channa striata]|uniref:Uncharacterized protein n=1 Tax=Channa striata TaxID=64152 RepID=A0AA88M6W7_CHASR|nr:hypothetical protein Q5P01_017879 [Channa striata]
MSLVILVHISRHTSTYRTIRGDEAVPALVLSRLSDKWGACFSPSCTPTCARFDVVKRAIRGADVSSTLVNTGDGLSLYECVSSWKTDTCLVFDQGCRGEIPRTLCSLAMADGRLRVDFTLRCVLPDGGEDLDLRDLWVEEANAPIGTRLSLGFLALREMTRLPSAFSVLAKNENVLVLRHLLRDAVAIVPKGPEARRRTKRSRPAERGARCEGAAACPIGHVTEWFPCGHSAFRIESGVRGAPRLLVSCRAGRGGSMHEDFGGGAFGQRSAHAARTQSGVPRRGRARGPQDEQTPLRSIGVSGSMDVIAPPELSLRGLLEPRWRGRSTRNAHWALVHRHRGSERGLRASPDVFAAGREKRQAFREERRPLRGSVELYPFRAERARGIASRSAASPSLCEGQSSDRAGNCCPTATKNSSSFARIRRRFVLFRTRKGRLEPFAPVKVKSEWREEGVLRFLSLNDRLEIEMLPELPEIGGHVFFEPVHNADWKVPSTLDEDGKLLRYYKPHRFRSLGYHICTVLAFGCGLRPVFVHGSSEATGDRVLDAVLVATALSERLSADAYPGPFGIALVVRGGREEMLKQARELCRTMLVGLPKRLDSELPAIPSVLARGPPFPPRAPLASFGLVGYERRGWTDVPGEGSPPRARAPCGCVTRQSIVTTLCPHPARSSVRGSARHVLVQRSLTTVAATRESHVHHAAAQTLQISFGQLTRCRRAVCGVDVDVRPLVFDAVAGAKARSPCPRRNGSLSARCIIS